MIQPDLLIGDMEEALNGTGAAEMCQENRPLTHILPYALRIVSRIS